MDDLGGAVVRHVVLRQRHPLDPLVAVMRVLEVREANEIFPEASDLHFAVFVLQHILRLEISVTEASGMEVIDDVYNVLKVLADELFIWRFVSPDLTQEIIASSSDQVGNEVHTTDSMAAVEYTPVNSARSHMVRRRNGRGFPLTLSGMNVLLAASRGPLCLTPSSNVQLLFGHRA